MIILFLILTEQLTIQNKPQETTMEKKASCRGKQTSTEFAVTWTNFLHELLRAAA